MPTESYIDISVAEINAFWLWRITTACLGNNEMNVCKAYVAELPWEMIFFYNLKVIKICQRPNSFIVYLLCASTIHKMHLIVWKEVFWTWKIWQNNAVKCIDA